MAHQLLLKIERIKKKEEDHIISVLNDIRWGLIFEDVNSYIRYEKLVCLLLCSGRVFGELGNVSIYSEIAFLTESSFLHRKYSSDPPGMTVFPGGVSMTVLETVRQWKKYDFYELNFLHDIYRRVSADADVGTIRYRDW